MLAPPSAPSFVFRVLLLLLLLASPALAQTDPANPPTQPPATAVSSSQSSPGSPPPLAPDGFLREPLFLSTGIDFMIDKFGNGDGEPESGFYPELSNMITGAGWVSAGPGYRQYLLDRHLLLDGSAAVSWRLYKMVQGHIELPDLANDRLTVGAQVMWQDHTQVNYFGIGSDSLDSDQSHYRMQSTDVVGYASVRPRDWLAIDGTFGWLPEPKLMAPGGTFKGDFPDSRVFFPTDPAASLARQPDFLHGGVAVTADTRDDHGRPTSGGRYRAALTTYSDRTTSIFSFRQYEAEATQFVPLADRRWVLAFRGWAVLSDVAPGHEIPFYLLPSLGGHNTLRDYHNFQFHDRNALVVNAESRWAVFTHLDAAVFFDAGNVAAAARQLNLDKTSYGAGLRVHTERATIARFDVATGAQGWQIMFRTSDPFRLSRGRRHVAAIPFTP
ncbi:MAG TPA: BamA/TamA family outer membrane protein [Vicinamibacterales bacterium]